MLPYQLFAYGGDDVVEVVQLPMLQEALGHCTVTGQRAQNHAGKPFQTNTVSLPRKKNTKKSLKLHAMSIVATEQHARWMGS